MTWSFSNVLLADDQLGYVPDEEHTDDNRCVCGRPLPVEPVVGWGPVVDGHSARIDYCSLDCEEVYRAD